MTNIMFLGKYGSNIQFQKTSKSQTSKAIVLPIDIFAEKIVDDSTHQNSFSQYFYRSQSVYDWHDTL